MQGVGGIPINKFRVFNQDVVFLGRRVSKSRFFGFSSINLGASVELVTSKIYLLFTYGQFQVIKDRGYR
jgi:hypothetical protein